MKRTNSHSAINEILAIEAFKSTGFLIVNKTLIKQLGLIPAVLLSNYIDKYIYFKEKFPNNGNWFYLTHEQQMEQLHIGEHSVIKYKNFLKEKGILKTNKQGIPAKEWLNIDFEKLVECLDLTSKTLDPVISGGLIYKETINKDTKKNIILPTKKPSIKIRSQMYIPLAKNLSEIIHSNKNVNHSVQQINTWVNDIRQLVETDGIDYNRIEQALNWYRKNIGGQYIPVVESGRSLRDKFIRLEAAMGRENSFENKKPQKVLEYGEDYYLQKDGKYRNNEGRLLM